MKTSKALTNHLLRLIALITGVLIILGAVPVRDHVTC